MGIDWMTDAGGGRAGEADDMLMSKRNLAVDGDINLNYANN
jgi:hypothetical protein